MKAKRDASRHRIELNVGVGVPVGRMHVGTDDDDGGQPLSHLVEAWDRHGILICQGVEHAMFDDGWVVLVQDDNAFTVVPMEVRRRTRHGPVPVVAYSESESLGELMSGVAFADPDRDWETSHVQLLGR